MRSLPEGLIYVRSKHGRVVHIAREKRGGPRPTLCRAPWPAYGYIASEDGRLCGRCELTQFGFAGLTPGG